MTLKFEKHINVNQSEIILDCLSRSTELSRQQLKQTMKNGAVWLESSHGVNRTRRAKKICKAGDTVHIYYDSDVQLAIPPAAMLIADEGDYSIWNKPAGMYSQGSKWGDHCTIYRWAEQHLQPQRSAFIVHRLDRAASGLIIVAHKKTAAAKFSEMFSQHKVYKKYRAEVEGVIEGIDLPFKIQNELDGKKSISEIVAVTADKNKSITEVEIIIQTGRKHQIRRHLSGMGHPIKGDRLYAAKDIKSDLQLSSVELKFICPISYEKKHYKLTHDGLL